MNTNINSNSRNNVRFDFVERNKS